MSDAREAPGKSPLKSPSAHVLAQTFGAIVRAAQVQPVLVPEPPRIVVDRGALPVYAYCGAANPRGQKQRCDDVAPEANRRVDSAKLPIGQV